MRAETGAFGIGSLETSLMSADDRASGHHSILKPMAVAKGIACGQVTTRASGSCFHFSGMPLFPRSVTAFTGLPSRLATEPSEVIFNSLPGAGTVMQKA